MKCLSLWQPWASFVAWKVKPTDTRSWCTEHRGPLAIHASKTTKGVLELSGDCEGCIEDGWRYGFIGPDHKMAQIAAKGQEMLIVGGQHPLIPNDGSGIRNLPLGCILCVVDLVDCVRMPLAKPADEWDEALGNWEPGRFAWRFENVRPLIKPIPYRGAQGLFDVPDHLFLEGGWDMGTPEGSKQVEYLHPASQIPIIGGLFI